MLFDPIKTISSNFFIAATSIAKTYAHTHTKQFFFLNYTFRLDFGVVLQMSVHWPHNVLWFVLQIDKKSRIQCGSWHINRLQKAVNPLIVFMFLLYVSVCVSRFSFADIFPFFLSSYIEIVRAPCVCMRASVCVDIARHTKKRQRNE